MNLNKKRRLAAEALQVGRNRIVFNPQNLNEIKEAITKQDIKALHEEGAILIAPIQGRKTVEKRTRKRGPGKIKMKILNRKQNYVKLTRKLRAYVRYLKENNALSKETYYDVRKKIKNKLFKSKANLKEYLKMIETAIKSEKKKGTAKTGTKSIKKTSKKGGMK
jgi:large subunit ribosomal protein L19e